MRKGTASAIVLLALAGFSAAQQSAAPSGSNPIPRADTTQPAPTRISLNDAIRLALRHDHALLAARTTILQNQAQEITANLRPNPVISWDSQFFPLFNPSEFNSDYIANQ